MDLVFSKNSDIFLDTVMGQDAFAKTRFSEQLDLKGVYAYFKNSEWNFEGWSFSGTKSSLEFESEKSETILIEGKSELENAKTLYSILNECDAENIFESVGILIECLEDAKIKNQKIPDNGAEGILIDAKNKKIIFIPKQFYTNSLGCMGDEFSNERRGIFIHPNLRGDEAISFFQATLIYFLATKKIPYANTKSSERSLDLLYKNYIPLKLKASNLNEALLKFVDDSLTLDAKFDKISKQKTELNFPRDEFLKFLDEQKNHPFENKKDSEYDLKVKKIDSLMQKKFWIRKNKTKLSVAFGAFCAALIVVLCYVDAFRNKPTTIGLTSKQTVEFYLTAMNNLDVDAAQYGSTKNNKSNYSIITNIYISEKGRSMYDSKTQTKPFAQWCCYNQTKFNIYGLAQCKIENEDASIFLKTYNKKSKPKPVLKEDEILISTGDTKIYNAEYFIAYTPGMDDFLIMKEKAQFTLVYKKNRWLVDSIATEQTEEIFSKEKFILDYNDAVKESGNKVEDAVKILCEKYYFMPTQKEIYDGAKQIEERGIFG